MWLLFATFVYAQYSLSYKVEAKFPYLVGTNIFYVTQTLTQGTIQDGGNFTIPKVTLSQNLSQFQGLADALENSIVGLEPGALKENVTINFLIEGMDVSGKYSTLYGASVFWFVTATVTVNGTPVTGNYYFQNGKKLYWKFKKSNLTPFVQQCIPDWQLNDWNDLGFAFFTQDPTNYIWITNEISAADEGDYFSLYTLHLSRLAGGRGKTFKTYPVSNEKLNINTFYVAQNYPNPFNPTTVITFSLPKSTDVTVEIYNAIGTLVSSDYLKNLSQGIHNYKFNANNLPTGIYYARIKALNQTKVIKMLYIK